MCIGKDVGKSEACSSRYTYENNGDKRSDILVWSDSGKY